MIHKYAQSPSEPCYSRGCRCDDCRTAHRLYRRVRRLLLYASGRMADGRLLAEGNLFAIAACRGKYRVHGDEALMIPYDFPLKPVQQSK